MIVFIPNPNFIRELAGTEDYLAALEEKADLAASHAREFYAPVGETGDYKASIRVTSEAGHVYLGAFDFKAGWIEFGTVDTPVFAPLRLGVTSAEMEFRDPGAG